MTKRFKIRRASESEKTPHAGAGMNKNKACSLMGRLLSALSLVRATDGAELIELGLALPLLLILVMGIIDFGKAYNTKHVMENASREAARIISSTPLSDSSCPSGWSTSSPGSGTPCTLQAAANTVANYMTNEGLSAAACLRTSNPTYTGVFTWTYNCNNVKLVIDKAYRYPVYGSTTGTTMIGTDVKLSYPYTFMFGKIVGLLSILGVNAVGPVGQYTFTTETVMQTTAVS
jgi:Flp pilus assembly protein TadG